MDVVAFQRMNQWGENWTEFCLLQNSLFAYYRFVRCDAKFLGGEFRFKTQYDMSLEKTLRVKESHPNSCQGRKRGQIGCDKQD